MAKASKVHAENRVRILALSPSL
ncbi:hypothetical protein CCACVL1_23686 [Corchorus capsularis]|uniref:Uncharacterized protein n=1 Tax=Corchorus capsularis TaxID=210143 RepID=A0A1R3GSX0_COCAP|nr:hypothetical protein CCACVL1_23686 [Corchorus capsularis]